MNMVELYNHKSKNKKRERVVTLNDRGCPRSSLNCNHCEDCNYKLKRGTLLSDTPMDAMFQSVVTQDLRRPLFPIQCSPFPIPLSPFPVLHIIQYIQYSLLSNSGSLPFKKATLL